MIYASLYKISEDVVTCPLYPHFERHTCIEQFITSFEDDYSRYIDREQRINIEVLPVERWCNNDNGYTQEHYIIIDPELRRMVCYKHEEKIESQRQVIDDYEKVIKDYNDLPWYRKLLFIIRGYSL